MVDEVLNAGLEFGIPLEEFELVLLKRLYMVVANGSALGRGDCLLS
jgi:hypothetical protein